MNEVDNGPEGDTSGEGQSSLSDAGGVEGRRDVATGSSSRHQRRDSERFRHTRTSAVWAAVFVAVLFGVALVDFIAQNTREVRINFFSVHGRVPGAVALLAAALAGAIVVLAVGVGRVAQLRLNMYRQRRQAARASDASEDGDDRPTIRGRD